MNKLAILSSFVAVAGIGFYLINQNDKKVEKIIDKTLLIKILKNLSKQYYDTWERMIEYGKQQINVQNTKNNPNYMENQKNLIQSKFQSVIEKIEQKVYIKFEVTQEEVHYNCNIFYKNDDQIQELINYINQGFEQALQLELNLPICLDLPNFINEDLILNIQSQILISSALLFNQKIKNYQNNHSGERVIKYSNSFYQILAELKQHSQKEEILKQNGFDQLDEASSKIYFDSLKMYSENRSFKQKLVQLNENYDLIMSEILEKGQMKEDDIVNKLKY